MLKIYTQQHVLYIGKLQAQGLMRACNSHTSAQILYTEKLQAQGLMHACILLLHFTTHQPIAADLDLFSASPVNTRHYFKRYYHPFSQRPGHLLTDHSA